MTPKGKTHMAAARVAKAERVKAERPVKVVSFAPQEGPQTDFLATKADIAIFGGSAGGGKSHACLLAACRHRENPEFHAVIFRREGTMIRNAGGLWDKSVGIMMAFGAKGTRQEMRWKFPSGSTVKMSHMEREVDRFAWQGAEVPLVIFEELTQFAECQFWYLLSRLRSMSGVPGRIRASCNPDPDSFVAKLIAWWIDDKGYAIPERSGVLRWFIRVGNSDVGERVLWADSREELVAAYPTSEPKSLTFIRSSIKDNKALMERDPGYLANLMALPYVERMRLLEGNWKVKPTAGNYFRREWFKVVDRLPDTVRRKVRAWDRAATAPSQSNPDPDYTAGVKVTRGADGTFYVEDVRTCRLSPGGVEDFIKAGHQMDGIETVMVLEQEPGASGVADITHALKAFAGFHVAVRKPMQDKVTRANPASTQVQHGNVVLLRAEWNDSFIAELENFPDGAHDDQVDGFASAINYLTELTTAPLAEDDFAMGPNDGRPYEEDAGLTSGEFIPRTRF